MPTFKKEALRLSEWVVKEHPDFFKDLDKISTNNLGIFYKKKQKIKQNPLRFKHLSGGPNCYREAITDNIRLVYYVKSNVIWLLTIGRHNDAYKNYVKRLHSLREKFE